MQYMRVANVYNEEPKCTLLHLLLFFQFTDVFINGATFCSTCYPINT